MRKEDYRRELCKGGEGEGKKKKKKSISNEEYR